MARGRREKAGRAGWQRGWEYPAKGAASVLGWGPEVVVEDGPGALERSQVELSVTQDWPKRGAALSGDSADASSGWVSSWHPAASWELWTKLI